MDKPTLNRKTIGLVFVSDYVKWSGGTIYILNIISALNTLDDSIKPTLKIVCGINSPIADLLAIEYPYLELVSIKTNLTFAERIRNTFVRMTTNKSVYFEVIPDTIYPYQRGICLGKFPIHWIPDFQEWYLPQMFPVAEIKYRKKEQERISRSGGIVVFSSKNALGDFQKFYPNHNCELRLLRFASSPPKFDHLDISMLKAKYGISGTYFMSPNQFWKHKNHMVILKAICHLKKENLNFQVVFTGSENDHRNKEYFKSLKDFTIQNEISDWVKFLGFISREDQLSLMNNAMSIIQPSLFEGWSTVVEDAKSLSQFIILSDIPVHKEQIDQNCIFFSPESSNDLSIIMERVIINGVDRKKIDYSKNISDFGHAVLAALS